MADEPTLTEVEKPVAAAYKKTGKAPDDPHKARILDYLITAGLVEEKQSGGGGGGSESAGNASRRRSSRKAASEDTGS